MAAIYNIIPIATIVVGKWFSGNIEHNIKFANLTLKKFKQFLDFPNCL